MAIDPAELRVATEAVQKLIDDNVPRWAKMMMSSDTALKIARTVLKAVDEARSGKRRSILCRSTT